jgi:hypothetical protein
LVPRADVAAYAASERVFTQHPRRRFQIRRPPTARRQWNKDIGIFPVPNNVARTNVGARAFWLWDVAGLRVCGRRSHNPGGCRTKNRTPRNDHDASVALADTWSGSLRPGTCKPSAIITKATPNGQTARIRLFWAYVSFGRLRTLRPALEVFDVRLTLRRRLRRWRRLNGCQPPPAAASPGSRTTCHPELPAVRHAILELFARLPPQRCPHCRKWICNEQRRE